MTKKKTQRRRRFPQRTCVGCRSVETKRSLIRLVRTPEGIKIDPTGKEAGRGAYVHNEAACWEAALRGSLARALKTELDPESRNDLLSFMKTEFAEERRG